MVLLTYFFNLKKINHTSDSQEAGVTYFHTCLFY